MQTLNVGAGRTDQEYKAAEEQRRADLRSSSQSDADYFFFAAALSAIGTGILPIHVNFLVSIGAVDPLRLYARPLGSMFPLAFYGLAVLWTLVMVGLGFAARRGQRWAFLAGIAIYAADMIFLIVTFSIWAFGLHAFFLFKWFQGQKALKDMNDPGVSIP